MQYISMVTLPLKVMGLAPFGLPTTNRIPVQLLLSEARPRVVLALRIEPKYCEVPLNVLMW